jgi:FdhD protein
MQAVPLAPDAMSSGPIAPRPSLSQAMLAPTVEVEATDETGHARTVRIAGEHPLTIYVDRRELVTLMTLGQAPEALTLGYLRNQRLVTSLADIAAVQVDWEVGAAVVTTRAGIGDLDERMQHRTVTTGCGQGTVFGDLMTEIDAIALRDDIRLAQSGLAAVLEAVRQHETVYRSAGAVHGCALLANETTTCRLLTFVEDVGRHNAVDTIAGQMWLENWSGDDKIFYTTGRLTSEMVIKAAQMRIPFLVSRSGLTQMGHDMARRTGMTMIGRAINRHFLLFTGAHRFVADTSTAAGAPLPAGTADAETA